MVSEKWHFSVECCIRHSIKPRLDPGLDSGPWTLDSGLPIKIKKKKIKKFEKIKIKKKKKQLIDDFFVIYNDFKMNRYF